MKYPNISNNFNKTHIDILFNSLLDLTKINIFQKYKDVNSFYEYIYNAPFALVSHGTENDPIFNYGNKTAQKLFELDWIDFTKLPSRKSAEKIERSERTKLLNEVSKNGYINNYKGIRISKSGKRFYIKNAIVWNLYSDNNYYGQAAMFENWEFI